MVRLDVTEERETNNVSVRWKEGLARQGPVATAGVLRRDPRRRVCREGGIEEVFGLRIQAN
jgi:hypothetical protein